MEGWVKLYRSILNHELFLEDKPFTKRDAFIDTLLRANHKDNKFLFDGVQIEVKKGQHLTSVRVLTERWGWSSTKVRKFLKLLAEKKMIEVSSDKQKTIITVVNWDLYQGSRDNDKSEEEMKDNKCKDSIPSYCQRFLKTFNIKDIQEIQSYLDDGIEEEVIFLAVIDSSKNATIHPAKYCKAILDRCLQLGIKTVEDYNASVLAAYNAKKGQQSGDKYSYMDEWK